MKRLTYCLGVLAIAILMGACDKAGGGGGMTPADYTSNKPSSGTVPCADGSADCAIVPADAPKPVTLGISFPDFPNKTEFQALPGTAFTLLVATTAADAATLSCTPENAASFTPVSPAGSYLIYLNAMPNKDVPCTITAISPKGEVKASFVVHPASKNTVIPLDVRNLPPFVGVFGKVVAGKKEIIANIYIDGFEEPTSVTATCTVDPKPQLIKSNSNVGWYNLEFTPSPAATGTCTVTATRTSDNQTASDTVTLLYGEGPTITPVNFLASAKLLLVPFQGYFAVVDPGSPKLQFPILKIENAVTVTAECSDEHGAKLMMHTAAEAGKDIYKLTIGYSLVGDEGSTDTCTVTATDAKDLVSTFTITLVHASKPLSQQVLNIPPNVTITGKPIVIQNITVIPMDASTKLDILCTVDKKALITPTGNTFSATVAQVGAYNPTDNCIIVASHNGIQTAIVPLDVTVIYAKLTPKNFGADKIIFMGESADKTHYYAFSVDNNGNADNPIFTLDDPEGIVSATLDSCSGPNESDYDATKSSVVHFPGTNAYYLQIQYGKFIPGPDPDSCAIKAVDSTGQVSYEFVYLQ